MYTPVDSRFWDDEWVRTLSTEEKLLFFYLLTNPHRNMLGLYVLPEVYAKDGTQLTDEQFAAAWSSLTDSGKIVYDTNSRTIFIKNFLRFNPISGEKQIKGAFKRLMDLPRTRLFKELYKVCASKFAEDEKAESLLEAIKSRTNELVDE